MVSRPDGRTKRAHACASTCWRRASVSRALRLRQESVVILARRGVNRRPQCHLPTGPLSACPAVLYGEVRAKKPLLKLNQGTNDLKVPNHNQRPGRRASCIDRIA
ncbi:hypothetical protein J6590_017730 [Homalodisca vitripennis]|nr:hypothetical protein J6590_017730 [Homalodisca vitripennis]